MTVPIAHEPLPYTSELGHAILKETAGYPGSHYRVLQHVLTAVELGVTLRMKACDIAAELGVTEGTVSKAFRRLTTDRWLEVSDAVSNVAFYRAGSRVFDLALQGAQDVGPGQRLATVSHLPTAYAPEE
ncbi:MarR family transcriptional regulator (plasmid) [Streptomyces albidoflavus]|uniref:hypothetical protein n=1 Tax=Streptomyces albidoflavus TaxID=1886 RepID=UPI002F91138D|nr:MarR family transcriptional regulator [Streptomyces albidoflavus]